MIAHPRVLAVLPGFSASAMITVVKPLLNLHRAGQISARIVLESQAARGDIDWADALVLCRNNEPRHAHLLSAARARGLPLIYNLDDNLLDLPPCCQGSSPSRDASRRAMLEEYLRAAALVRVYSQSLAERVAALNPRVARTFAPVDLSLVPPLSDNRPPWPIKIVYATPRPQDPMCEIFLPALLRILKRHAGQVEAHFWGYRPPQIARAPNARHHGLISQYDRFLWRFSRCRYDIGLAPLPDDLFFRSKTNNKFREYGACGIAGIYSLSPVYAECVEHEASGLLVANDVESWYDALQRLIEDEALRTQIQQRARQYVIENCSQEKFDSLLFSQIREVLSRGQGARSTEHGVESREQGVESREQGVRSREQDAYSLPGTLWVAPRSLLPALWRLGPQQSWTALRWYVSDHWQAARLRWQLRRPAGDER
jgi:hypothetical protein